MAVSALEAELEAEVSVIRRRGEGRSRTRRRVWTEQPRRDEGRVSIELDSELLRTLAEAQLHAAMRALGVGELTESLSQTVVAVGVVNERDWRSGAKSGPSSQATGDGLPQFVDEAQPQTALSRSKALLGAIESVNNVSKQLDGVVFSAARQLTASQGAVLLADKRIESSDELNKGQTDKWRKATKSVVRGELEPVLGWWPSEVADLVAASMTPTHTAGPMLAAMQSGEASWRMAMRFFREARGLAHEDAGAIANAMFGDDLDAAVTERLDSSGDWLGQPWGFPELTRACRREVAAVNSRDEKAKQEARDRAKADQDLRVRIDEIGTAAVILGCSPMHAAAIADRVEKAARSARAAGAPETMRELRSAIATALLLHGSLSESALPDDPDSITVEHSAELTKVLLGLPAAELNVIVPLDTLLGTGVASAGEGSHPTCNCQCRCGAGQESDRARSGGFAGEPCPAPGCTEEASDIEDRPNPHDPGGVAAVVGRHQIFLTPHEVRQLALVPGSTLFRLLTDPVTGRCVERSIKSYPFDTSMRAQIAASDVFCRAPGCLKPARMAQMDHVQEHGTPGGHTCEANGQPLCEPHHDRKTKKAWDAIIDANRDVTWTTMLGRIYVTKAHDLRQYTRLLGTATTAVHEAIDEGIDREDAINAAIYQALSYREDRAPLQVDEFDDGFFAWGMVDLTHTGKEGRRVYYSDPEVSRAERDRHRAATEPGDADPDHANPDDPDSDGASPEGTGREGNDDTGGNVTLWSDCEDDPPPF